MLLQCAYCHKVYDIVTNYIIHGIKCIISNTPQNVVIKYLKCYKVYI